MKDLLEGLDQLKPIETNVQAQYSKEENIKACIFDIYGTLLISASGDIDLSDISTDYLVKAFKDSGIEAVNGTSFNNSFFDEIIINFENSIHLSHEESKKDGFPYPEVDILEIWEKVLADYISRNKLSKTETFNLHRMTSEFEIFSNKIYPMPGAKELIETLNSKKLPLGIISNAQFYTPIIMNYFLTGNILDSEEIKYFEPDITVYSYKERRAKPDVALFNKLLPGLQERGIKPHEAIFIGNDMLKDIYTAKKAGLKTVLFAGDKRSLRWRENNPLVKGIKPDHVITHLSQILEIV